MVVKTARGVAAPPANAPRVLVIGAGCRGNAYAAPMFASGMARIVSVAEPRAAIRKQFSSKYIHPYADHEAFAASAEGEGTGEFPGWDEWFDAEKKRLAEGKPPSINIA